MTEEAIKQPRTVASISTAADPPDKIELDGVEYDLYGLQHLGKDKENKAVALFARHEHLTQLLYAAENDRDAERISTTMRGVRIDMIVTLTTIPHDVADALPLHAQQELVGVMEVTMRGGKSDPAGG